MARGGWAMTADWRGALFVLVFFVLMTVALTAWSKR
jgi:hypothetical protein